VILLLSICIVAFTVVGVPIAFAILAGTALVVGFGGALPLPFIAQRISSSIDNFTYLAIPLFVLAGNIMETSGISLRLVALARALVGHFRGGMGQVVIVSEIFFSGISGASLSDASAIGSIMFTALRRAGYPPEVATALIAAACAMGILIPPCLTMVVLGAISGVSVSALFVAGLLPGLVMAVALMAFVYWQARRGVLPAGEPPQSWRQTWDAARAAFVPMMMPAIIFGGIFGGVFTPTEAAAVAVLYAFAVSILWYRELTFRQIYTLLVDTAAITGAIGLILGAATAFSTLLAIEGGPAQIAQVVIDLTTTPWVFLVLSNLVFVVFGALLDGIPAILLFIPILLPIAQKLGIDPLHFTLLSVASLGIGIVVPPIGVMLLVICSITRTPLRAVSWAMIPYLAILLACLLAIILFPWIVLVLPRALGL
jgi:C4-dicarboxylate transporter DctM subunit